MYESHFGFSSAPFQLNPDPSFLFESKGHGKALSYLRFGVQQGEGFIVISGDVGAGKTTLVRALLSQLDPQHIVAAQVSNTQLDASDLLQSILTAFGVPAVGQSKAGLIARMEAFLTQVAASGRRALLVVDEAQNLSAPAIEELRMLSNFQLGHHGLMQSFLVGQPELREHLQSPAMEQLRQRILASYHLGPLDADETRAYVLHRLRHVGWQDRPSWDDGALAAVHRRTGGIPRRINMLCNRLLLAAYLGSHARIGATLVDETADELWDDVTRSTTAAPPVAGPPAASDPRPEAAAPTPEPVSPSPVPPDERPVIVQRWVRPAVPVVAPAALPAEADGGTRQPLATIAPPAMAPVIAPAAAVAAPTHALPLANAASGPVIAVADDPWSWAKLQALARRWSRRPELPALVLVHPGAAGAVRWPGVPEPGDVESHHLEMSAHADPAQVGLRLAAWYAQRRPAAVIVAGHSYALLHAALAARRAQLPVIRLDAGERRSPAEAERGALASLIDRTAEWLCAATLREQQDLATEGFGSRRIARVGPLATSAMHDLRPHLPGYAEAAARLGFPADVAAAGAHGLITAQFERDDVEPADALQWVLLVRHIHAELPLVWLASARTQQILADPVVRRPLDAAGIAVVPRPDGLDRLALLDRARCVVAGPARDGVDEARGAGVPALVLDVYGDAVQPLEGGGVWQVGPSVGQVKAAMQDVQHAARPARVLHAVPQEADDVASALVQRMGHWLAGADAPDRDEHLDEAVA